MANGQLTRMLLGKHYNTNSNIIAGMNIRTIILTWLQWMPGMRELIERLLGKLLSS